MPYARGAGVVVKLSTATLGNAEIVKRIPGDDVDRYVIRVRRRFDTVSERDIVGPVPTLSKDGKD